MAKRPRGRPRKIQDSMEPWQFGRLAKVTSAYDEARKRGEKHSVAVRMAVDSLRVDNPEMPISETAVRRILSTYRPRGSGTILLFERAHLSEEDIEKYRFVREQIMALNGKMQITPPPAYDAARPRSKITFRFAARPHYPRHNRKTPKE